MTYEILIRKQSPLVIYFLLLIIFQSCTSKSKYTKALTPEEAIESFQIQKSFKIEVFAAEPFIFDPVDMTFDEFGNAYVVEMPDYPDKPEKGKGRGRIRFLEDLDGDGRMDSSIIFQDSLSEATSIMPWMGGLLVCAAPEILYLKDTNGDHVADYKEVLFTGFYENNSEAQITNLQFNIDNWIYGSNNGNPGLVTFLRKPEKPAVSTLGTDFRFRLDQGLFESAAGSTQFGQAIDKWGHRFGTQNTIHISQIVIPLTYLNKNPKIKPKAPIQNISDHDLEMFQLTPAPYWRAERTRRRQKKYKEQDMNRVEYAEDHFTGSSGGTIYNGHLFPESYIGSVFTGEVAGNLIHRDVLISGKGPLFIAKRDHSETKTEFLSSTDPWFRPTNFEVAPDGSLLVMDMYRQHIETPLSIPEDLKEEMDFYNGNKLGRIYRISPIEDQTSSQLIYPGEMETKGLVRLLEHPHQWWRLTAQRLLIEKQDSSILPLLNTIIKESEIPEARLHAAFIMEGLEKLPMEIVELLLKDDNPEIRARGVQFAEKYPGLIPILLQMKEDPSNRVAFQLVLSLGLIQGSEINSVLASLLNRFPEDKWFQKAILISQEGHSPKFLNKMISQYNFLKRENSLVFVYNISSTIGVLGNSADVSNLIKLTVTEAFQNEDYMVAVFSGLSQGLKNNETKLIISKNIEQLFQEQNIKNIEVKKEFEMLKKYLEFE